MLPFRANAFNRILCTIALIAASPVMGQNAASLPPVAIGTPMLQSNLQSQSGTASQSSIQIYNVPTEMVGVVGARLRVLYGNDPRINVTTEPVTGRLMIMAPLDVHRDIASRVELLQKRDSNSPG